MASYKRRSTLIPLPPAEDDPSSLGSILTMMGTISNQQLQDALSFKRNNEGSAALGEILVSTNTCSQEDINTALSIQTGMRSANVRVKAGATADVAIRMKQIRHVAHGNILQSGSSLAAKLGSLPLMGSALIKLLTK